MLLLFLQIRFFLLQNRQGKTRLSKWYVAIEEAEKRKIENEVHRLVTARDNKFTNFVEVSNGRSAGQRGEVEAGRREPLMHMPVKIARLTSVKSVFQIPSSYATTFSFMTAV